MSEYQEGQKAVDNATGKDVVYQGGQWVEDVPQQVMPEGSNPDVPPGGGLAAPAGAVEPDTGGITWPANGPLDMLGAFNPAFAGTLGIGQAARGLTTKAVASVDPIATAMEKAAGLVKGVMPNSSTREVTPLLAQARERAAQTIGRTVAPGGRAVGESAATTDELAAIGFPMTKGDMAFNAARTGTDEVGKANALREGEQRSMSGLLGRGVSEIKSKQQEAATNWVGAQLGLPEGQLLTRNTLADVYQAMGTKFDEHAQAMGAVNVKEVLPSLKNIADDAFSESQSRVTKIVGDIEQAASKNGGRVTGEDWQRIRTDIVRMQEAGTRQGQIGKVSDASELMNTMTQAMEDQLPDLAKGELRDLRHRYALLSSASKGAAADKDGLVNVKTLFNNWTKPQSNKYKGQDEFGRMLEAFARYVPNRVPDSGTAGRLMLQGAADVGVPGAGIANTVVRAVKGN